MEGRSREEEAGEETERDQGSAYMHVEMPQETYSFVKLISTHNYNNQQSKKEE